MPISSGLRIFTIPQGFISQFCLAFEIRELKLKHDNNNNNDKKKMKNCENELLQFE